MKDPYSDLLTRREFVERSGVAISTLALPTHSLNFLTHTMQDHRNFEVIILGGSYSGLAAGMALGRAMRQVLIIDSSRPCNEQTPRSHNFLTHDGKAPGEIALLAKQQVQKYDTVKFLGGLAISAARTGKGFEITTSSGDTYAAKKLIFATGIKDIMSPLDGFKECWGISVLHCPYCHGYEVKNENTGILANGEKGFEFAGLISNWTNQLTLFTNGVSTFSGDQVTKLSNHRIKVVETEIAKLDHTNGHLQKIIFKDGTASAINVLYAPRPFEQHSAIPEALGCEMTDDGYIKADSNQRTSVHGIYACGDNTTRTRTVANAVAMGTIAGMMTNKEIVLEAF